VLHWLSLCIYHYKLFQNHSLKLKFFGLAEYKFSFIFVNMINRPKSMVLMINRPCDQVNHPIINHPVINGLQIRKHITGNTTVILFFVLSLVPVQKSYYFAPCKNSCRHPWSQLLWLLNRPKIGPKCLAAFCVKFTIDQTRLADGNSYNYHYISVVRFKTFIITNCFKTIH